MENRTHYAVSQRPAEAAQADALAEQGYDGAVKTRLDVLEAKISMLMRAEFTESQIYGFKSFSDYDRERIQKIIKSFNEKSERDVIAALENSMISNGNQAYVIGSVRAAVRKRQNAFEDYKRAELKNLQLYAKLAQCTEEGNTRYIVIDRGENCAACDALCGKIFDISTAQIGVNCPPFHPNCDGLIAVLDQNGMPAEVLGTSNNLPDVSEIEAPLAEALKSAGLIDKDTEQSEIATPTPKALDGFSDYEEILESAVATEVSSDWKKDVEALIDYLQRSIDQVALGNYSDDATMLGTAGQIAVGFTGLDVVCDIRDLAYDLTHWEWTFWHIVQTLFDIIALFPVIGSLKYGDEILTFLKKIVGNIAAFVKKLNFGDALMNSKLLRLLAKVIDGLSFKNASQLAMAGGPEIRLSDYLGESQRDWNSLMRNKALRELAEELDKSKKIDDIADGVSSSKSAKKVEISDDGKKPNKKAKVAKTYSKDVLDNLENTEIFEPGAIEHIFEGQVNRLGKATGYHYDKIDGVAGKIIPGTKTAPNKFGVYKARVEVNGVVKRADSTFFPDDMDCQEVVDAIVEAYCNRTYRGSNKYRGYAKNGMKIEMYLDGNDKIISAFPIY